MLIENIEILNIWTTFDTVQPMMFPIFAICVHQNNVKVASPNNNYNKTSHNFQTLSTQAKEEEIKFLKLKVHNNLAQWSPVICFTRKCWNLLISAVNRWTPIILDLSTPYHYKIRCSQYFPVIWKELHSLQPTRTTPKAWKKKKVRGFSTWLSRWKLSRVRWGTSFSSSIFSTHCFICLALPCCYLRVWFSMNNLSLFTHNLDAH